VHSHSGNTLCVAEKLLEQFQAKGHEATIERVVAANEDPSAAAHVVLKIIPDTSIYDILIFAAPVRAFSLSPVMKPYLSQLASLKNKKIGCFVTEQLPYPWMGGNKAIQIMKKLIEEKEGEVLITGIVNWSSKKRDQMITDSVNRLINLPQSVD
jgi:NAD(P)H dehydrogenase (quinone)